MKVQPEKTSTTAVGMQKSRAFHFEFNPTTFETLSQAYSDPIRAVIRELACNSSDAHVMAGTKKQFEIHLPTTHEPEFIIRDFGTGMDDQEINDLFTMYGGSNKRDNNEVIGALGIGSKSPYAVTPMYQVISTKNGITRTYTATVQDEDGEGDMPILLPGSVTQTPDALNGVTVQFSVPEDKIWEYENKAKIALEFFEPLPKINVHNFTPHKMEYILKGESWGFRKEARTAAHGFTCRAIMGKVQYQIGDIDQSRTNSLQKKILEMPIDMHFPLGTLSFAPSREALKLNDRTIAAVLAMCDKIFAESIQTVKDKIDACANIWDAQILLYSLINSTSNSAIGGATMSGLIEEALKKGKLYGQYKNFNLSEQKAVINALAYNSIAVSKFEYNTRATKRAKKDPFIVGNQTVLREDRRLAKATGDPLVIARNRYEIVVKPDVVFVINDTKLPGDKYVHYHIQESQRAEGKKLAFVIHKPKTVLEKNDDLTLMVKNAKKLIADLGNPPVKLMSDLVAQYAPLFAQRRAAAGPAPKARRLAVLKDDIGEKHRYTSTGWGKAWKSPDEGEVALSGKKFYVAIEKLVAINSGFDNAWSLREFVNYIADSGKFGIDRDTPIYGVKSNSKLLKENDGEWVELIQHVYCRVTEIMTPQKTLAMSLYLTPFTDELQDLLIHLAQKQPLSSSPAQCFAVALADAKAIKFDNWSTFKWVLDFCQTRGKYKPGKTMDFNTKWQQVKALYPMLAFVGSYDLRKKIPVLVDYIQQVDEQNFREAACKAAASNQ